LSSLVISLIFSKTHVELILLPIRCHISNSKIILNPY
jgi:hypothetical protein